jgi:hypothetical protein
MKAIDSHKNIANPNIDDIAIVDKEARKKVTELIRAL